MRAAIVNPYLDTLGGGERYSAAVAEVLLANGYDVSIEWKEASILKKLETRFGINLGGVKVTPNVKRGDGFDVCFWVSDGSIPALKARKNFLHFQVPFHDVSGNTLLNRMKLFRIAKIICNSNFTKSFIDKEYHVNSIVIYPPIGVDKIKPKRKENIILFVGRFSQLKQVKNQDLLIKAFKNFYTRGFDDWKLILAGGSEIGGGEYVRHLKKMVGEYPITIFEGPSFKELVRLYGQAKIFWSAVGYGANDRREPEKVEHFGISLVEAMAAGCVPVAFRAGGYKEIIRDGKNGFLWKTPRELLLKTKKILTEKGLLAKISVRAREDSLGYGYEEFSKAFSKYL